MLQPIQTARLQLIPFSLTLKKATLEDRSALEQLLGVHVPPHWPLPDYLEALPFFIQLMENDPKGAIWDSIILHTADQQVINDIGFKGGPDEQGMVEIGYSILPEYRGAGYATEMAQGLISWAFQHISIRCVTAECLDDNIGSIKVLEKIGMQRLEPDGSMLKWRRERPTHRSTPASGGLRSTGTSNGIGAMNRKAEGGNTLR
nr:GNAT family N-acetyltransferase [Ktedonobacter robiniae]